MVAAFISVPSVNSVKRKPAISAIRIRVSGLKYLLALWGSAAELQKTAHLLLDAFAAPWKDREPTALAVSKIATNDVHDTPPPVPKIGQVYAMRKHVNPRKATGVDGVPAWLVSRATGTSCTRYYLCQ